MSARQPKQFVHAQRVAFADTDMAGILHFGSYFRYLESAEHEFWRSIGLSVYHATDAETISWPRVSAQCDYRRPVRFDDLLEIRVRIADIGAKSITFDFDLTTNGDLVATGRIVTVCCRVRPGEPLESVAIPSSIRERLLPYHSTAV